MIFKFLEEEVDKELLNQAIEKLSGRENYNRTEFGLKNGGKKKLKRSS